MNLKKSVCELMSGVTESCVTRTAFQRDEIWLGGGNLFFKVWIYKRQNIVLVGGEGEGW